MRGTGGQYFNAEVERVLAGTANDRTLFLAYGKDIARQRDVDAAKGTQQVAGTDCDKVSATYTSDQVGRLLGGGLSTNGDVHATVWVGRSDHLVRRTVLSGRSSPEIPLLARTPSTSGRTTVS